MRDLSNAPGIGVGGDFVNGDLVDNQTQINEFINQDLIQFFQKLADLAGIVFNDLPDNETNDYQLIEAFETVVRNFVATTLLKGTVENATASEIQSGTTGKFVDAALLGVIWEEATGSSAFTSTGGSLASETFLNKLTQGKTTKYNVFIDFTKNGSSDASITFVTPTIGFVPKSETIRLVHGVIDKCFCHVGHSISQTQTSQLSRKHSYDRIS